MMRRALWWLRARAVALAALLFAVSLAPTLWAPAQRNTSAVVLRRQNGRFDASVRDKRVTIASRFMVMSPTAAMMLSGGAAAGGGGGFGNLAAGTYYITRAIDHTKLASENRTDDLVLVVDATFAAMKSVSNSGHVISSAGADIHVTDATGTTEWTFYLEKYTASSGAIVLWIKPPSTTSSSVDRTFLIAYGDATITVSLSSKANTFPATIFDMCHGLGDDGSGGVTLTDRSPNAFTLTNHNTATLDTTAGLINGGAKFTRASSQYFSASYQSAINHAAQTILALVKTPSSFAAFEAWYERQTSGSFWHGFALRTDQKVHGYVNLGIGSTDAVGGTALSASTQYVVAFSHTGTSGAGHAIVYVNGTSDGTAGGVGQFSGGDTTSGPTIGGNPTNSSRYNDGSIGEMWVLNGAMSAGWIGAHSNALLSPSTFSTGTSETAV